MTEPFSEDYATLTSVDEDQVAILTLRIEVTLSSHAEDIPALTPMLAATMASLLYPHGREVRDERPA